MIYMTVNSGFFSNIQRIRAMKNWVYQGASGTKGKDLDYYNGYAKGESHNMTLFFDEPRDKLREEGKGMRG